MSTEIPYLRIPRLPRLPRLGIFLLLTVPIRSVLHLLLLRKALLKATDDAVYIIGPGSFLKIPGGRHGTENNDED